MFNFKMEIFCLVVYLWLSLADNITTSNPCFNCSEYNSSIVITVLYNISTTTDFFPETDETGAACSLACQNGGTCIVEYHDEFCKCTDHFDGPLCEIHVEPSQGKEAMVLLASLTGMTGIILVFIALIFLLFFFSRKAKLRKERVKLLSASLSNDFTKVNKQLEIMTVEDQMQLLNRLSKLIDATARAALITYPSIASVEGGKTDGCATNETRRGSFCNRISCSSYRRFSAPYLLDTLDEEPDKIAKERASMRESMRFVSI